MRVNISIPEDLRARMKEISKSVRVNWSKIAVQAFDKTLRELEEVEPRKRKAKASAATCNLTYAWEKLYSMVSGLASAETPLQERLVLCFRGSIARLFKDDFPEYLRPTFTRIIEKLKELGGAYDKGRSLTTVLGQVEAVRLVEEIVGLYDNICRLDETSE